MRTTNYPYSTTTYYFAGTPVVTEPNPPSWGVEALHGALRIWSEQKPAGDLLWGFDDYVDGLTIKVESAQSVMVDLNSILAVAIEHGKTRLAEFMEARNEAAKAELQAAIEDVLGDSWAADLIEYVIGGVLDLQALVVALGAEFLTLVLAAPTVVVGELRVMSELTAAVDINYQTTYAEGWKLQVSGERSPFPELRVEFTNDLGTTGIAAGAAHPQGFYSLVLLGTESIQAEAVPLPTASSELSTH